MRLRRSFLSGIVRRTNVRYKRGPIFFHPLRIAIGCFSPGGGDTGGLLVYRTDDALPQWLKGTAARRIAFSFRCRCRRCRYRRRRFHVCQHKTELGRDGSYHSFSSPPARGQNNRAQVRRRRPVACRRWSSTPAVAFGTSTPSCVPRGGGGRGRRLRVAELVAGRRYSWPSVLDRSVRQMKLFMRCVCVLCNGVVGWQATNRSVSGSTVVFFFLVQVFRFSILFYFYGLSYYCCCYLGVYVVLQACVCVCVCSDWFMLCQKLSYRVRFSFLLRIAYILYTLVYGKKVSN